MGDADVSHWVMMDQSAAMVVYLGEKAAVALNGTAILPYGRAQTVWLKPRLWLQ